MNLITRLLGLSILVVMLLGTAILGGKFAIYIDLPSMVMVIGVLFGGALLCFPVGQITDAMGAAFAGEAAPPVTDWRRQSRIAVFARLYQLAWGGGLVGALIGLVAMLSDLSDPASIGAGIAVALVAPLYGAALAEFVFNPMQQLVMNQRPTPDEPGDGSGQVDTPPNPVPAAGQTALFKGVAMIAIIVSMFMVLFVSFSEITQQEAISPHQQVGNQSDFDDDASHLQAVSRRFNQERTSHPEELQAIDSEAYFRFLVEQKVKELENERANEAYDPGLTPSERREAIGNRQKYISLFDDISLIDE